MKRIKNFTNFYELDFISESRVYFLNDLSIKLTELMFDGNEWAGKLLKAQGKDIDSDTTFLTLDGENFTFSKEADLKKVLYSEDYRGLFIDKISDEEPQRVGHYLGSNNQNNITALSNRGKAKIGRVIKKIIPEIPDKDLEILVNSLKSETTGYEIKLVSGKDISNYYKKEYCDPKLLRYGTLQGSCMMDKESEKPNIFDIYTKNPESCQLAVMLNSDGQLVGRALVWKVDEIYRKFRESDELIKDEEDFYSELNLKWERLEDKSFDRIDPYKYLKSKANDLFIMDRVYYTKDWIENAFYKWANQQGFMIRSRDWVSYKGKTWHPTALFIKVNKLAYRQFPYMDTFKYYDVQAGLLSSEHLKYRGFHLNSTSGEYYPKGTKGQKRVDKATNFIRRFKDYL